MAVPEVIYLGHDNVLDYALQERGLIVPQWGTSVTRVTVQIGNTVIDSDVSPAHVYWDEQTWEDETIWVLHLHLGTWLPPLAADPLLPGSQFLRIVVFDPDHPNGLVWGPARSVEVV